MAPRFTKKPTPEAIERLRALDSYANETYGAPAVVKTDEQRTECLKRLRLRLGLDA